MREERAAPPRVLGPALLLAAVAALASAGCASSRAQTEPELPALNVPAPPARVLPPLEGGPIEGAGPTTSNQAPPEGRPQPRHPAQPRTEPGRSETRIEPARPEAPPEPAPAPAEPPVPEPSAPTLQLAPPGTAAHAEQQVRQQLNRAAKDLNDVDYGALAVEARSQYDTAKRFMLLADQAIKDRNLIFAQTLADKAAAIAAVLLRR